MMCAYTVAEVLRLTSSICRVLDIFGGGGVLDVGG